MSGLPDLPFHVRLDALSAFFLLLLGLVSAGISVYCAGYFESAGGGEIRLLCLQYHVFLASMALVLLADDAYLFMVAWETMALASYFLVTTDHEVEHPRIRNHRHRVPSAGSHPAAVPCTSQSHRPAASDAVVST